MATIFSAFFLLLAMTGGVMSISVPTGKKTPITPAKPTPRPIYHKTVPPLAPVVEYTEENPEPPPLDPSYVPVTYQYINALIAHGNYYVPIRLKMPVYVAPAPQQQQQQLQQQRQLQQEQQEQESNAISEPPTPVPVNTRNSAPKSPRSPSITFLNLTCTITFPQKVVIRRKPWHNPLKSDTTSIIKVVKITEINHQILAFGKT
uniref:Uncharacterized protein n=1 Tax=Lygus hesperus TaxID=30085 RepID=A0A0K8S7P2_LYGHE